MQRNVTVSGAEYLLATGAHPVLDAAYIKDKVMLAPGVALKLTYLVLARYRATMPSSSPGIDLLARSPAGAQPPPLLLLYETGLVNWVCFPINTSRKSVAASPRSSLFPGPQQGTGDLPQPGCPDLTPTPPVFPPPPLPPLPDPMSRCWAVRRTYIDIATDGTSATSNGRFEPTHYVVAVRNTRLMCASIMTEACVLLYGPIGCYTYLVTRSPTQATAEGPTTASRPLEPPPPSPRPAAVAAAPGSSSRDAVVGGAVGGAVGGCALLAAAAAGLLLWRRRHRQREAAKPLDDPDAGAALPPRPIVGSSCNLLFAKASATVMARISHGPEVVDGQGTGAAAAASGQGSAAASKSKSEVCDSVGARSGGACGGAAAVAASVAAPSPAEGNLAESNPERGAALGSGRTASTGDLDASELCAALPVTALTPRRLDLQMRVQVKEGAAQDDTSAAGGSGESCASAAPDAREVRLLPITRGRGAFGRVVEGMWQGRRVAVKLVSEVHAWAGGGDAESLLRSFGAEVEVLGRCCHPNVVRLLAACLQPPRLCLVMELCETSLERLLWELRAGGRLMPMETVLHIAREVARGLEYLHPTIMHRDLKPANVLINDPRATKPGVKLADFGLSRLRNTVAATKTPGAGTPAYLAPEGFDARNDVITHHADIYSFGCLCWNMLTGEAPWHGCNLMDIACNVAVWHHRPPLDGLAPGRCPPKLRRLLGGCWESDPWRRPAAAELVKELTLVAQGLSGGACSGDGSGDVSVSASASAETDPSRSARVPQARVLAGGACGSPRGHMAAAHGHGPAIPAADDHPTLGESVCLGGDCLGMSGLANDARHRQAGTAAGATHGLPIDQRPMGHVPHIPNAPHAAGHMGHMPVDDCPPSEALSRWQPLRVEPRAVGAGANVPHGPSGACAVPTLEAHGSLPWAHGAGPAPGAPAASSSTLQGVLTALQAAPPLAGWGWAGRTGAGAGVPVIAGLDALMQKKGTCSIDNDGVDGVTAGVPQPDYGLRRQQQVRQQGTGAGSDYPTLMALTVDGEEARRVHPAMDALGV